MKKIALAIVLSLLALPAQADITSNLDTYLTFDDGSGTNANDSTANNHDGTLTNGPTWGTGVIGGCVILDGSNDYVAVAGTSVSGASDWSVSFWGFNNRAYNSGTAEQVFSQFQASATVPDFGLIHFSDNNLYAGWQDTGDDDRVVVAASAGNWPQNTWTHYCITADHGGTTTLYVNGVSVGTQTGTTGHTLASTLRIGVAEGLGANYQGAIDDFRIYSRVLSGGDVGELFALGGGGLPDTDAVAVNNAGIFWAPYVWKISGSTSATANQYGAYLKTDFTGSLIGVKVDVSAMVGASVSAGDYPWIESSVDGGPWIRHHLTSSDDDITMASSLGGGTHHLVMRVTGISPTFDLWTTPVNAVKILNLFVEADEAVTIPTVRAKRMIAYGDSITTGVTTDGFDDTGASWVEGVAEALNCEFGNVGVCATGWETAYGGTNSPSFNDSWDFYSNGQTRLVAGAFAPVPDYIIINHGENDASLIAGDVSQELANIRTAAGTTCRIVVVTPFGARNKSTIETGVANYKTSSGDNRTVVFDGTVEGVGSTFTGATMSTSDGVHPDAKAQGRAAAIIVRGITGIEVNNRAAIRYYYLMQQ